MPKVNAMLVVLNEKAFKQTLPWLNFDNVNLVAAVTENGSGKVVNLNGKQLPLVSFAFIHQIAVANKNLLWLICGFRNNSEDLQQTKDFLMLSGIPERQIVNFELSAQINPVWIANLHHIEQNGADVFATGSNAVMHGLDLKNIYSDNTHGGGCINLAETNQDLRQSFLTAKHIFQHVKRGRVKFVFIGLTPYSLHYDNRKDFSACTHDLQYALTLNTAAEDEHGKILQLLISNQAKSALVNAPVNPDLNFDALRSPLNFDMPAKSVANWQGDLQHLTKTFDTATVAENLEILKSYIKLCRDNGAKPVGVMFPFAPAIKERCDAEILALFRMLISQLEETHGLTFIDLFDLKLEQAHFSGIDTLNRQGALLANSMLKFRLFEKKLLSFENICAMKYESFDALAYLLPKETYNELLDRVLDKTVKQLRHKKKIKVGFVLENAGYWCGDELYKHFARNEHFEPKVFLFFRQDNKRNEETEKEFLIGTEQFKSANLDVVALTGRCEEIFSQDILFFLSPYLENFSYAFNLSELNPHTTLLTYIPYGFNTSEWDTFNKPLVHIAWKLFLESMQNVQLFQQKCITGAPRALYSGYPRMDIMFEENHDFEWKMARPDAKKIIYAPHWSINGGIMYSTFQWNYKFMYEFAKAHPEISWVVKPHPKLPFFSVDTGVFPNVEAYREYIQKWNDLPNAKVYTGAYYHAVFATSDGMILDCGSFIGEYQYTHKPMIFLTRDTQRFNDLGKELMQILYRVDGRDLKNIAALMQKVFIDGKDDLFDARMKFFDKYFNYPKHNGISASEFIYNTIAKELKL